MVDEKMMEEIAESIAATEATLMGDSEEEIGVGEEAIEEAEEE